MESLVGVNYLSEDPSKICVHPSSVSGIPRPSQPSSPKLSRNVVVSSASHSSTLNLQHEEVPSLAIEFYSSSKGKSDFGGSDYELCKAAETSADNQLLVAETKSEVKCPGDDSMNFNPSDFLESENSVFGSCNDSVMQSISHLKSQPVASFCPSPQNSLYSATFYAEAKESFTSTEVSGCTSSVDKSGESGDASNSYDFIASSKTSMYRGSTGSDVSDDSSSSGVSITVYKPHKANDKRWEAIQVVRSRDGALGLNHFKLLKRLGCGDIGSVYLSELTGTRSYFAMKVMDKTVLASRKKLLRSQTEREILQSLDHPFLPTLYSHFDTEKYSCLLMEYCPGGDLHALRQGQARKCFPEHAVRFYVSEVLLALEYLHMLGIIYRDLKPENVLVRDDGHIMLSDFDLSLRCAVNPTLVKSSNSSLESKSYCVQPTCVTQPNCIQPACFGPRLFSRKPKKGKKYKSKNEIYHQVSPLPELMAEPTSARSMSFVGTHEYLAPEIIKGEGHGSAVDWWTFGIFIYELLFGKTPFEGSGNRGTLFNVVGQPLRFPESPNVSFAVRDLIRGLLVKEPQHRLAYRRGATEVKQHPFFQSINWALIRCTRPPYVPKPFAMDNPSRPDAPQAHTIEKGPGNYLEIDFF